MVCFVTIKIICKTDIVLQEELVSLSLNIYIYIYTHKHIYKYIHMYMYMNMHTMKCMKTWAYIYISLQIYMYTHTHTHTYWYNTMHWFQQSFHQMITLGSGMVLEDKTSLPLTQSVPAVTHDTTRLCWIDVTLWIAISLVMQLELYLGSFFMYLMEKVLD